MVFDGYTNSYSTKLVEQARRYRMKKSTDINFNWETKITTKQEDLLSNVTNKSRLISMLMSKLQDNGINTLQATDDAVMLIVDTAINLSETNLAADIGEDVDLLVLLLGKTPTNRDILLVKPGRGRTETTVFSSQELQQLGLKDILFLHAFSGCDTTSSVFSKSKVGFLKL